MSDVHADHVKLAWKKPKHTGGLPLSAFVVEKMDTLTGKWVPAGTVDPDATEATVTGKDSLHQLLHSLLTSFVDTSHQLLRSLLNQLPGLFSSALTIMFTVKPASSNKGFDCHNAKPHLAAD